MANTLACIGSNPPYCSTDTQFANSLACADFAGLYVLDVLKTGKYTIPNNLQKILTSGDIRDAVIFQKLKEAVGVF
jgi:hypothetical protein